MEKVGKGSEGTEKQESGDDGGVITKLFSGIQQLESYRVHKV